LRHFRLLIITATISSTIVHAGDSVVCSESYSFIPWFLGCCIGVMIIDSKD
jgi:chemotaxis receptor (MCP) glutamine deamidase CheD